MCQNTKNMKITPVTDICSKGDFVTKRVLTHPPKYILANGYSKPGLEPGPDS